MYERILAAIDFSEPSAEAFRWAARRFPEAEITLFHALERGAPPAYVRRALGDQLDLGRERELDVRTNLELLAEEAGVPARIAVGSGWAPAAVERAASEVDAGLVVVGAHTRRIWPWDEPGATASSIVDQASRPVLVWRPRPRQADPEDRTVLAALDLRERSEGVGPAAAEVSAYFEARMVLIHVLPRTLQAYLRAVSTTRKAEETLKQVGDAARRELVEQVPPALREELEIQPVVVRGRPVTQILAAAENEAANLIVMGQRHAPSRTGRALMGSVTGSVLRGANCSVLVLPR